MINLVGCRHVSSLVITKVYFLLLDYSSIGVHLVFIGHSYDRLVSGERGVIVFFIAIKRTFVRNDYISIDDFDVNVLIIKHGNSNNLVGIYEDFVVNIILTHSIIRVGMVVVSNDCHTI